MPGEYSWNQNHKSLLQLVKEENSQNSKGEPLIINN
jgi:hypothetical protein